MCYLPVTVTEAFEILFPPDQKNFDGGRSGYQISRRAGAQLNDSPEGVTHD